MVRPLSLNEKLHLVVPIYADDGETIVAYIHSAPIMRETFEAHYLILSKTFAAIHTEGLGVIAGPRVASYVLHDVAKKSRDEMGAAALMNEIRRLTSVCLRNNDGWENMQFQDTVDLGRLAPDDVAEVLNALVFFIVTSAMQRKQDLKEMMDGAARLWGARTSYLDFTAFAASLGTSTQTADTVSKRLHRASSVPY
jgi:hypothetical protein